MKKIYVGIDPGISGGIAAIDELGDVIFALPTPCLKITKKGVKAAVVKTILFFSVIYLE